MEQENSPITLDQVVAYNLRRARQHRGWTQAQAAEQLEPFLGERWSSAVFSAAERSYEGNRIREFTASHVLAFSLGFDLPIAWFYEPPTPHTRVNSRGSDQSISGEDLVKLLGSRTQEAQDALRKTLKDLLIFAAASGTPDHGLVVQGMSLGLSLGLLTVEDTKEVLRVFQALAPRRESAAAELAASFEKTKGEE